MGKAMAQSLAQAGSDIVIVDLDLEAAQQAADLLAAEGTRTLALRVDITNPADVDKMTDEILGKFGHIDVLFNNAGIAQWVNAEDMSLEDWRRVMSVNLCGRRPNVMPSCEALIPRRSPWNARDQSNPISGRQSRGQPRVCRW